MTTSSKLLPKPSSKLFPKHWASGFDSMLWRGVNTDFKYRTDTTYLFCGPNLVSILPGKVLPGKVKHEIIVDSDINPAMPVWHISLVPNVGQSKLYPLSATRMLRKISIGNYAYFARPLTKSKIAECHGVKLLDMYIGIEYSAMFFIDQFSVNKGLILRFINDARLWQDCINDGAKYSEPVTDDVKSYSCDQYNPLAVPRGTNPYNSMPYSSMTIGDLAWNFLSRCAQAICEYAISETFPKGFNVRHPFHYLTTGVYENIEQPLLKLRTTKFRELVEFIHTARYETKSQCYRLALSFLREIGIYPIV